MKQLDFTSLSQALKFVSENGGPKEDIPPYTSIEGWETPWGGAFGPCYELVRLHSGAIFGVLAYNHGPLSEVTPDEDFGVKVFGLVDG